MDSVRVTSIGTISTCMYHETKATQSSTTNNNTRCYTQTRFVGRKSMHLELFEEQKRPLSARLLFGAPFTRRRPPQDTISGVEGLPPASVQGQHLEQDYCKGAILVSWYCGTSTVDLLQHIRVSIVRKVGVEVENIHILDPNDTSIDGDMAEVVLSTHIPSESQFVAKFTITPRPSYNSLLSKELGSLPLLPKPSLSSNTCEKKVDIQLDSLAAAIGATIAATMIDDQLQESRRSRSSSSLFGKLSQTIRSQIIKRHVMLISAMYFFLFLSMVAIFSELHERAPNWLHNDSFQTCAVTERFSLRRLYRFTLDSRVLLFGLQNRQQLWTVLYESFVTGFCGGFPFMFLNRGLNPDTRHNFFARYWKDAVFGTLAGFNVSFMKAVLKNLIPHEVVKDVFLKERNQLGVGQIFARLLMIDDNSGKIGLDEILEA